MGDSDRAAHPAAFPAEALLLAALEEANTDLAWVGYQIGCRSSGARPEGALGFELRLCRVQGGAIPQAPVARGQLATGESTVVIPGEGTSVYVERRTFANEPLIELYDQMAAVGVRLIEALPKSARDGSPVSRAQPAILIS